MRKIKKKHISDVMGIAVLFLGVYAATIQIFSLLKPYLPEGLSCSDCLSFWGNYLNFFSTLILSLLVYRQNQKIASLTLAQNEVILGYELEGFEYESISFDNSKSFRIPRPFQNELNPPFYECNYFRNTNNVEGKTVIFSLKLFSSKSIPVKNLQLTHLTITGEKVFKPAVFLPEGCKNQYMILPENNTLRICCIIYPAVFDSEGSDWLCKLHCSFTSFDGPHKQTISFHILEYKNYLQAVDGVLNPRISK